MVWWLLTELERSNYSFKDDAENVYYYTSLWEDNVERRSQTGSKVSTWQAQEKICQITVAWFSDFLSFHCSKFPSFHRWNKILRDPQSRANALLVNEWTVLCIVKQLFSPPCQTPIYFRIPFDY